MSESLMALGHLSYNQEYMKHREALGCWNAWVIKNTHVPKSPSKLAPKRKGRRKRSTYLVLCPVCAAHCGRCFIHLLTWFNLLYNNMSCRVAEEKTEAQSGWGALNHIISGTLEPGTSLQIHELDSISYLPPVHAWYDSTEFNKQQWLPTKFQVWCQKPNTIMWMRHDPTIMDSYLHTLNLTVLQYEPSVWQWIEGAEWTTDS